MPLMPFGVFINFGQISYIVLVFLLLTLNKLKPVWVMVPYLILTKDNRSIDHRRFEPQTSGMEEQSPIPLCHLIRIIRFNFHF